jgi:hypothetical protein
MKTKTMLKAMFFSVMGILMFLQLKAQNPPLSPAETATGKIGQANVTIDYSSPGVKGRKIWGELVPYGKPWRAGANKATILTTDKDLTVEGHKLPAGKYSVFITPAENGEWGVIFNSETGQWGIKRTGEANFDPTKNVIEIKVKPKTVNSLTERLTYNITGSGIEMHWEHQLLFLHARS